MHVSSFNPHGRETHDNFLDKDLQDIKASFQARIIPESAVVRTRYAS